MNASRDQALLGLALQSGLINQQQAALVRDRHRQFAEAKRPVSVSALLRALKFLTDQQLESLEQAAEQARTVPAPAAATAQDPPAARPNTERRRTTGAQAPRASPTHGVPVAPPEPMQLGKYRLLKTLGQGGMGAVYLAEDTHLNRKVALKVLPKELAANREFIKRFLAEARITGKLSHPNIVVAYDIDSSQNTWFMAMEHLEGESLGRRLLREGAIPWRDALNMLKQILRGLTYAHKNGIIHRDIKPDNLFLDRASGETKILDLGLSKNLHATENAALTQAGMILGTPNYLAPEQAENGINVDHRADLYSLGATLYHMLAGAPPFDGPTPLAIIQKHLFEPFPDLRKSKPDIPADVANLVWKMTAKKPADRFADSSATLQAVDDILEGRGFRLNDPMIASGRRSGSGSRNRPSGSGQNAAVRAGTRITRNLAPVERRSRTGPRTAVPPIALFSMLAAGLLLLIGLAAWMWRPQPDTPAPGPGPADNRPLNTPAPIVTPLPPPTVPLVPTPAPTAANANDTEAIFAVINVAGRGLTLSGNLDRELEIAEKNAAMQRLLAAAQNSDSATTAAPATDNTPTPSVPVAANPVLHTLTADERKTARTLLNGFKGDVVFRMNVPQVGNEDIQNANIRNLTPPGMDDLQFLQLGPPPRQMHPQIYQGVSVEPTDKPNGQIRADTRIRMILRIESSDQKPVDLRLMYSNLPDGGRFCAGGAYASMVPCDFTLVDVPLQRFRDSAATTPWFGYACGDGPDFAAKRKLTLAVSDIIIYNPKP